MMSRVVVLHDDAVTFSQEAQGTLPLEIQAISREKVKEFLREAHKQSGKSEEYRDLISRYLWPCTLVEARLRRDAERSFSFMDIAVIVPAMDEYGNRVVLTVDGQDLLVKSVPSSGLIQAAGFPGNVVISAVPENTRDGLRVEFNLGEDGLDLNLLFGEDADARFPKVPHGLSRLVSVSMREGCITAEVGDPVFRGAFLLVAGHPDQEGIVLYFAPKADHPWAPFPEE